MHGDSSKHHWDVAGQNLDSELESEAGGETHFVYTDVTDYDSVLRLFDTAWKKYGRVDIAISNAGIQEVGNLFDPGLDLDSVKIVSLLSPQTKGLGDGRSNE